MSRVALAAAVVAIAAGSIAPSLPPPEPPTPPFLIEVEPRRPRAAADGPAAFAGDLARPGVEIAFAGDVNLGGRIGAAIEARGAAWPWELVAPMLRRADVAVVNLECAVSTRGTPRDKEYVFRGHPSSVAAMAEAGVDVASVANNHSMDYGPDAFADTLAHLRRHGVAAVGGGATRTEAYAPRVLRVDGLSVAFVAATRVLPHGFAAAGGSPGVASAYDEERLLEAVRLAADRYDVVVVLVHWGTELATDPGAGQVRLAKALVDSGAAVVAGHHPHVLQPVVRYRGAVVAYSLGNFVFSSGSAAGTRTMLLRVGIGSSGLEVAREELRISGGRPGPA